MESVLVACSLEAHVPCSRCFSLSECVRSKRSKKHKSAKFHVNLGGIFKSRYSQKMTVGLLQKMWVPPILLQVLACFFAFCLWGGGVSELHMNEIRLRSQVVVKNTFNYISKVLFFINFVKFESSTLPTPPIIR